jgi:hypothetical protein
MIVMMTEGVEDEDITNIGITGEMIAEREW